MKPARTERQAHGELVRQAEDRTAERDAVRRIIGGQGKLTEHDLDAHERYKRAPFAIGAVTHAHRYSACKSGPCAGGSKLCPSPEACQLDALPDDPRPPMRSGDFWRVVALVLASWAAVAFVLLVTGMHP